MAEMPGNKGEMPPSQEAGSEHSSSPEQHTSWLNWLRGKNARRIGSVMAVSAVTFPTLAAIQGCQIPGVPENKNQAPDQPAVTNTLDAGSSNANVPEGGDDPNKLNAFTSFASSESADKLNIDFSLTIVMPEGVSPASKTVKCKIIPVVNGKPQPDKAIDANIDLNGKTADTLTGSIAKSIGAESVIIQLQDDHQREKSAHYPLLNSQHIASSQGLDTP